MEIITGSQMRDMDNFAINEIGIPSIVLMEMAGYRLFEEVKDLSEEYLVVASIGNNGGDGLVLARHLHLNGKKIDIYMVGNKDKMSPDCKRNYHILEALNIEINDIEENYEKFQRAIKDKVVIEGIFGTGLSRNIEGIYADIIDTINSKSKYIVSIDIPTGIDGDNGKIWGKAIKADKTVTFHKQKQGLVEAGQTYTGLVKVKYIGIAEESNML